MKFTGLQEEYFEIQHIDHTNCQHLEEQKRCFETLMVYF